MGVYASIIANIIGTGIKLYGASQSPNYPAAPRPIGIPVEKAKQQLQQYEARRMQASADAWKTRFPLLYQGGGYEIGDIARNQQGQLSPTISQSLSNAGLEQPKGDNQYGLSADIGLSPITLSQRTSQAVTRQIALNPEWTNKISGGTLASMMANNYQNANAFSQFLGANQTAQYVAGQQRSMYNTAALTSGLIGTASIGTQAYINAQNPLNQPLNPNSYRSDVSSPGYYMQPSQSQPPPAALSNIYGNTYTPFFGQDLTQPPANGQFFLNNPYG